MDYDYKNLPPFKWFILENFPFIEADFDALTNWQLFCKLGKEMNKIINNINLTGEQVENLTNAFNNLKDYVDNYFVNLDVQEEINNKLDEMAESGELGELMARYVTPLIDEQNETIQNIQNNLNEQLDTFEDEITGNLQQLDDKITVVASGSPSGVYATVSDLTTADPDHDKIYLVTADGKWYYYNNSTTSWTEGGTYQASGIADNSIVITQLKNNLQQNIIAQNSIAGIITQTGTVYNGNVGSTANSASVGHASTGTLSVAENDIVYIPFANGFTTEYPTIPLILICDSDDTILAKYSLSDFLQTIDTVKRPVPTFLKMPANAYLLRFNNYTYDFATEQSSITIPRKITAYNYNDNRLNTVFNGLQNIPIANVISGKLYSLRAWDLTLASYNTYEYNVNPQEFIHLEHTLATANYLCNAIFSDDNGNITGSIAPYGNASEPVTINGDYIVPPLSTKMYISQPKAFTTPIVRRKIIENEGDKNIQASIDNGVLSLVSDTQTIIMQHFGGNNLFMIKSYSNKNKTTTITTDLIPAPYVVNAVNNANGDRTQEGFTGGNHQWNNQGSGSTPTAEEISLNFYADDVSFESGSVYCNKFTIVETNRVQANNTCLAVGGGRNVLEEVITYIFDGKELKITNVITPLEDIVIKRYYGVQLAGALNYKFLSDKIYSQANYQSVPTIPYLIKGDSGICANLKQVGLGTLSYNLNSNNYKCNYGANKAYYWLIDNNNTTFTSSDIFYYTCTYNFDELY